MTSLETVFLSSSIPIIGSLIMILVNRKTAKVQTEGMIADQYYKLTERLKQERDDLINRINGNAETITSLQLTEKTHKGEIASLIDKQGTHKREIQMLMQDNEECKYLHEVAELEMKHLKNIAEAFHWKRHKVFVLDDDPDVLEDFEAKFARLSVLEYSGFTHVEQFLEKAREVRPDIVVLDYLLDFDKTAKYVIESLGYRPEVFIMSMEKGFAGRFETNRVQFFVKSDNYILKIAKAIIQYLSKKTVDGRYIYADR